MNFTAVPRKCSDRHITNGMSECNEDLLVDGNCIIACIQPYLPIKMSRFASPRHNATQTAWSHCEYGSAIARLMSVTLPNAVPLNLQPIFKISRVRNMGCQIQISDSSIHNNVWKHLKSAVTEFT